MLYCIKWGKTMTDATLKRIYNSSLKFLTPLTLEKTYATIVKEATLLVQAEYGSILLEQNGELNRIYSSVPFQHQIKHRKKGFLYRAFRSGKPTVLSIKRIEIVHPEIKELSIAADVIIPLSYRNKSIGILAILTKREQRFSNEEINTLILFGSMASLAIRKAQLYDETKRALETRDFFISATAHEIKTPVTTIFGYTQLLFNNINKGIKLKKEWIEAMHSECYRLKFLINDLLEINRISSGNFQFDLTECSLDVVINRVTDNFKFNHPDRKLILRNNFRDKENNIIGDADRLIQALINVLDNAVKFSSSDSKILLALKQSGQDFAVKIQDQGKGITNKDLPRIFERYYQGKGTQHEGLGLGLFLVKEIIEHHNGSIKLTSHLNKGTTVVIRLPRIKK